MRKIDKYKFKYNILVYSISYLLAFSPLILFGVGVIFLYSNKYIGIILAIMSFFLVHILLKKLQKIKGLIGEVITRVIIQSYCDDSKYINMHNLLLRNEQLGYSQIDHLVITTKGIAVIETKYCVGYDIYGSEYDNDWTFISYSKSKQMFKSNRRNPLKQNYGHIMAIKELIEDESIQFYNIVSYLDTSSIKKCSIVNNNSRCIYTYDLPKIIENLIKNDNSEKIGITKMSELICKIKAANITDKNIRREHINKLKNIYNKS